MPSTAPATSHSQPVIPAGCDLEGVTDTRLPVLGTLAPAGEKGDQRIVRQIAGLEADLRKLRGTVEAHRHFLNSDAVASCKDAIETANKVLNFEQGTETQAERLKKLQSVQTHFQKLADFISYEKAQGLVGEHNASGVRIYLVNDRIWLCTPDQKAFMDLAPEQQKQLSSFVRGITGVELNFKECFQEQRTENGTNLLGCRLDRLSLKQLSPHEKYSVETHIRASDGTMRAVKLQFSLLELKSGKAAEVFGEREQFPQLHSIERKISEQSARQAAQHSSLAPQTVGVLEGAASIAIWSSRLPPYHGVSLRKPPGERYVSGVKIAGEFVTDAKSLITESQVETVEAIASRHQKLVSLGGGRTDLLKSAEHLNELAQTQEAFDQALAGRRQFLREQRQQTGQAGSTYQRIEKYLQRVDAIEALDVLTRKALLENQILTAGNPESAVQARATLADLADDINRAYKNKLRFAADPAEKASVRAEQRQYNKGVEDFWREQRPIRRALGKLFTEVVERAQSFSGWNWLSGKVGDGTSYLTDWPADKRMSYWQESGTKLDSSFSSPAGAKPSEGQLKTRLTAVEKHLRGIRDTLHAAEKAGGAALPKLDDLKKLNNQLIVRRGELLESLIESSTGNEQLMYRQTLEAIADDVKDSLRTVSGEKAAKDFAKRNEGNRIELERQREIGEYQNQRTVRQASAARAEIEQELAKPGQSKIVTERLRARLERAKLQEEIAAANAGIEDLEGQLSVHPEEAEIAKKVAAKRSNLQKHRADLVKAEVKVLTHELAEVQGKLAELEKSSTTSLAQKTECAKLTAERDRLKATIESNRVRGKSLQLEGEIAQLESQLTQAKNVPSTDLAGQRRIKALEASIRHRKISHFKSEVDVLAQMKSSVEYPLKSISAKIDALKKNTALDPAAAQAELSELEALKSKLELQAKKLGEVIKLRRGRLELVRAGHVVDELQAVKVRLLESLSKGDLSADQKMRLENDLKTCGDKITVKTKMLTALKTKYGDAWWVEAENWLQKSKGGAFLQRRIDQIEALAEKHPVKAALALAALTQGLRAVGEANYNDDDRHTFLPAQLLALDHYLGCTFFAENPGLTTKELGIVGSVCAEFTSHGGNAAIVAGEVLLGIKATQGISWGSLHLFDALSGSTAGSSVYKGVGEIVSSRAFGHSVLAIGSAADGFFTFYDYNSWLNATGTQLGTKTVSPVLTGATFGAFFGPVGILVGGGSAALGEAAGLVWAYRQLEQDIATDWRKKGVKESIDYAELGYTNRSRSVVAARTEAALEFWEREVLEEYRNRAVLTSLFMVEKSKSIFNDEELEEMGFRAPAQDDDAETKSEKGRHNYLWLKKLLEPRASWTTEHWYWSPNASEALYRKNKGLHERLIENAETHFNDYSEKYASAPRVAYNPYGETARERLALNEFPELIENRARAFAAKRSRWESEATPEGKAKAQWDALKEELPNLERILTAGNHRKGALFAAINRHSSKDKDGKIDLEHEPFWTHLHTHATGQAIWGHSEYMGASLAQNVQNFPTRDDHPEWNEYQLAQKQWEALSKSNPQLPIVLANPGTRRAFFETLKITGKLKLGAAEEAFWRQKHVHPVGQSLLTHCPEFKGEVASHLKKTKTELKKEMEKLQQYPARPKPIQPPARSPGDAPPPPRDIL